MYKKTVVLVENRQSKNPVNLDQVEQWLLTLLEILECEGKEISLTLVDDEEIRTINRDYLGRDRPTNVISFSMLEGDFSDVAPHLMGDIVISVDRALTDALQGDIPLEDMLLYLMIHGTLHLLGYEHEGSQDERIRMLEKEDELFFALRGYRLEQR